jgi:hypothetical protein
VFVSPVGQHVSCQRFKVSHVERLRRQRKAGEINAHVPRTDVKDFYAFIDHDILLDGLRVLQDLRYLSRRTLRSRVTPR